MDMPFYHEKVNELEGILVLQNCYAVCGWTCSSSERKTKKALCPMCTKKETTTSCVKNATPPNGYVLFHTISHLKDEIRRHLPKNCCLLQNVYFDIGCVCVSSILLGHIYPGIQYCNNALMPKINFQIDLFKNQYWKGFNTWSWRTLVADRPVVFAAQSKNFSTYAQGKYKLHFVN